MTTSPFNPDVKLTRSIRLPDLTDKEFKEFTDGMVSMLNDLSEEIGKEVLWFSMKDNCCSVWGDYARIIIKPKDARNDSGTPQILILSGQGPGVSSTPKDSI